MTHLDSKADFFVVLTNHLKMRLIRHTAFHKLYEVARVLSCLLEIEE